MQIFLEFVNRGIWDAVINGPIVPIINVKDVQEPKPFSQWSTKQNKMGHMMLGLEI